MAAIGFPTTTLAQAPRASITGQLVDAGGRAIASQRVDLVQYGVVIATTTTTTSGSYVFANVAEGEYVVRTMLNGTVAGVRVFAGREGAVNAVIVAPSVAAPNGTLIFSFFAGLGPVVGTALAVGIGAAIIGTAVAVSGS
jgi:hypothetical protein